ncbi:TetR/AcrR family transcriptional regulator [Fusibacillus kribbianus]|uniref:TetR/AcrR family transcriptional regulator n=1 Tax=Fusibacillus kribbianus TaxID=3044208 RepID=A0AAP4B9Z0_9FIRM|nr:TetR/AcrR family transcriptional regulator [Ruminococcus sp. YH-rum2234]MDI9242210.1 TetR/AcrR family transcriptional regulator [Ruminococcus sp. YH-rum2234]
MNKSESKYFNTALLMDEALMKLLEVKDFEYITVKEICAKAGVNRSTFYLHYETVDDLLTETMEYYNEQFLKQFSVAPDQFIPSIHSAPLNELVLINPEYLRPYLSFIKEHKSVYRAAFKNPVCMQAEKQLEGISEYVLKPIMKRFQIPEEEQSYWISFYIHGCKAIVQEWIKRNCEDPIEKIEGVMIRCIRPDKEQWHLQCGE